MEIQGMESGKFDIDYRSIREGSVVGRYVTHLQIEQFLALRKDHWEEFVAGASEEGRNIYELTLGRGPLHILMWSQMHGNETTTTKAVLDLLNTLTHGYKLTDRILDKATLKIIPMLNPDGAWAYTRANANNIDLNRDAQDLSQSESRVLRSIYDRFKPVFCFNLHDQRSIFSAGRSSNPATLSFLAPAADKERKITPAREKSMQLISAIVSELKNKIGQRIGRYDDTFNLNCVGDTFQSLGTTTLLFEAGHSPDDYEREKTRKYVWYALLCALAKLSSGEYTRYNVEDYLDIPNNEKLFFDVLVRNAHLLDAKYKAGEDVGILYKEVLQNGEIIYDPEIDKVAILENHYGHQVYDCGNEEQFRRLKTNAKLYSLLI